MKLCKNCKHHKPEIGAFGVVKGHHCYRDNALKLDRVDGLFYNTKVYFCRDERAVGGRCGPGAKYYKRKWWRWA